MSIAANEARQVLRGARRRTLHEARAKPPVQQAGPGDRAEELDLAAAMARLDPDDRRLIGMRYLVGLTSAEIAAELKSTPSSVRGRLARLLDRLRIELGDD
jgi:RNA polymerase sigma factor (sigma-70 family)